MPSNSNSAGMGMGLAVAVAFLGLIGLFVFAVLAFLAYILTLVALMAWNKPLRIGNLVLPSEIARAFVLRGVAGAILLPTFIAFCSLLFDYAVNWDYALHFMGFGYVAGSIGIDILNYEEDLTPILEDVPSSPVMQPPPLLPPPAPEPVPFRFASWNDEEELK